MSGVFSFGVNTADNLSRSAKSIDLGLQYLFDIDEKSTLLINCLPMGVKVNTRATVLAETSVREDMVFAVVKKFAPEFDQIILVGEGSFIKKIIEDGAELHEIDWRALRVHVVTGEEGIAENYRTYIGSELGVDDFDAPDSRIIGSSMGVAELDLNIFHETRETIRIRRLAHGDAELRRRLFGTAVPWCPMLFVYYPHRCYVEELAIESGHSELLMSMLSEEMKIPLLRYRSGDHGRVIPYAAMVDLLKGCGYPIEPDLRLPFVAVSGRDRAANTPSGKLFPEAVKEALYRDCAIARVITGNFRITGGGRGELHVQLRQDKHAPPDAESLLLDALAQYSDVQPEIRFYPTGDFPYNMSIDFERKFAYIG
jgi:phenylacetate-CoA ligase